MIFFKKNSACGKSAASEAQSLSRAPEGGMDSSRGRVRACACVWERVLFFSQRTTCHEQPSELPLFLPPRFSFFQLLEQPVLCLAPSRAPMSERMGSRRVGNLLLFWGGVSSHSSQFHFNFLKIVVDT